MPKRVSLPWITIAAVRFFQPCALSIVYFFVLVKGVPELFFELPKNMFGVCNMFYDRFILLCNRRGVTPSRAAIDAGLSKSTVTKWKNDPNSRPTGSVIEKLTAYFGISISELLGENEDTPTRRISEEELKFALFGGSENITHDMYEEVLSFAAFVQQREAAKKKKKE